MNEEESTSKAKEFLDKHNEPYEGLTDIEIWNKAYVLENKIKYEQNETFMNNLK